MKNRYGFYLAGATRSQLVFGGSHFSTIYCVMKLPCYLIVRIPFFYELLIDHSSFCFLFLDRPDPPRYPTCENIRDDSVQPRNNTYRYERLHTLNLGCSFITLREPCNNQWPRCDIAWLHVTNHLYQGFQS
jgi:hypothetical protein